MNGTVAPQKPNPYQDLLDEEIHRITLKIPEMYKGSEPICISIYQPTAMGGRLVLIDEISDAQNQIVALSPGLGARNTFLDPDDSLLWKIRRANVSSSMLKHYVDFNQEPERTMILWIYQRRFPSNLKLDANGGHVVEGTPYRLCYLSPPSLDNQSSRGARLGMAYTFSRYFGKNEKLLSAAKHLGEDVLEVRLRMLLADVGKYGPEDQNRTKSAWEIASDIARGIECPFDHIVFLVSKLLFIHHFIYPQHRAAVKLIQKLAGSDAKRIFERHGIEFPDFGLSQDASVQQLIEDLTADFSTLAMACAWHQFTGSSHAPKVNKAARGAIRDGLSVALTIICGIVKHSKPKHRTRKDKGYLHICPPSGIPFPQRFLPTFFYEAIKNDAENPVRTSNAEKFIETLKPQGPIYGESIGRGFYAIQGQQWVTFSGDPVTRDPSKEWFVRYARARCVLEFDAAGRASSAI